MNEIYFIQTLQSIICFCHENSYFGINSELTIGQKIKKKLAPNQKWDSKKMD